MRQHRISSSHRDLFAPQLRDSVHDLTHKHHGRILVVTGHVTTDGDDRCPGMSHLTAGQLGQEHVARDPFAIVDQQYVSAL